MGLSTDWTVTRPSPTHVPFLALWRLRNLDETVNTQTLAAYRSAFDKVFRALAYRDMNGPCFCESMALPHAGWVHSSLCLDIRRSLGLPEPSDRA